MSSLRVCSILVLAGLTIVGSPAAAQDFGRNKVQYDNFAFRVLATEHFDLYYYPEEQRAAEQAGRMAERWYTRLSGIFSHQLSGRQPVVLYASHPEFEQTNVVEGLIEEGTGGVTEGGQRRVVLPLQASLRDTDHVLGHELVHAFQYDILGMNVESVPLWFIEGMAEYLSIGPVDAQTAMWLRDAAIEGRLPTIANLDDPRYFPYRFGEALWAYIGGRWGDTAVSTVLHGLGGPRAAGASNPVAAIEAVTGVKRDALSAQWHDAIRETYGVSARAEGQPEALPAGQHRISAGAKDGSLEVGPALSPDGRRIAFLSSRSRLAVDLYVADAGTGAHAKALTRSSVDPHFESLQFLASAGSWAPDNVRLAVATVRRGRGGIAIFDTTTGRVLREVPFTSPGEIFNPAWSPDGRSIAFAGQTGGFTNLYLLDVASGTIRPLTDDAFADLQPVWSPDSHRIAFVTERFTSTIGTLDHGRYRIGVIDLATNIVSQAAIDTAGDLTNPAWPSADAFYFIATATGEPEIYRQASPDAGGAAVRLTDDPTGIAGVTPLSAVLTASRSGALAFSVFRKSGYEVRVETEPSAGRPAESARRHLDRLPPVERRPSAIADARAEPERGLPPTASFPSSPYAAKLRLLGVGQSIGVGGGSSTFGTYLSGGISMLFSDVLGRHLVPLTFDVNGGVRDIGAQAGYINRTHRWNWGVFGEQAPLLSGTVDAGLGTADGQPAYIETTDLLRQTTTQAGAMVGYPLSRATRIEFSAAASRVGFSLEENRAAFDPATGAFLGENSTTTRLDALRLIDVGAALVRDTSAFGAVGPIAGQRFRLDVSPTWGDLRLTNVTTDFRQYALLRPVTFAARILHVGRYGGSSDDERLWPLFLGYPDFVRGYDPNSFDAGDCSATPSDSCPEITRLTGSRMVVVNGEVRVPAGGLFTGNLDYGPVPTELFAFADAGRTWMRDAERVGSPWVRSVGLGARVNVFGFLIAEFNAARPLDRRGSGWRYVFNVRPGY
jgi:Tol biopolymer transport system component